MENYKLDPYFVTGLTDAEGCFLIVIKYNKLKTKKYFGLRFTIEMLNNETELLNMVKNFFDCGTLYYTKKGSIVFTVQDFYSIKNKIIPHFAKYPLRGTKYLDFLSFKEAFHMIESKEHLIQEGVNKVDALRKSMNTGRVFSTDVSYSPDHTKENNINYTSLDGHYVNGFITGDGSFILSMGKYFGYMRLSISQHKNNRLLMESIAKFFKSPSKVYSGRLNDIQINLAGAKLWQNVIFKHFEKYPLYGNKKIKFNKLLLVKELKRDNKHLMVVGKTKQWIPEIKLRVLEVWKN